MAEWWLQLDGDKSDLKDLARALGGGDPRVVEKDGRYYLRSQNLDAIEEYSMLRERATELLLLALGAVRLKYGLPIEAEITGADRIHENGRRDCCVMVSMSAHGTLWVSTPDSAHPSAIELLLQGAKRHPTVAEVLELLGERSSDLYITSYKIYEVIRDDSGGDDDELVRLGYVERKALRRLKANLNNPSLSGRRARHQRGGKGAPDLAGRMTPEEVWAATRRLVENWVGHRYTQP